MTEEKKSLKRTLIGKVVSDKRSKTVTVLVERRVKHALYGKIVAKSSKYHAHDENGAYHVGDVIEITESRPISRTKNWVVTEVEGEGCSIGPNAVDVAQASAGKTIALFALPGAFTPTCSAKHVPGYVEHFEAFKAAGVDEIWCLSVNDAFVMGAWARDQKTNGKVRMLADGSADFAKATGMTLDLTARGMGLRSDRYSMLVKDGKVVRINREAPGKFEVSNAETLLAQAQSQA